MAEPTLVRVSRKRCIYIGCIHGAFALMVLLLTAPPLVLGVFHSLLVAGLALGLFFGGLSIRYLGLAVRNPVGLRMDEDGISGYYISPARWEEIRDARAFVRSRNHRFLGFELRDPTAFQAAQTLWERLIHWNNVGREGVHLIIPQQVLEGATVEDLAEQAQALRRAAKHKDVT